MTKKLFWIIFLFLSMGISACSPSWTEKHTTYFPQAQCLPSFPDKDGWYGADAAYSIKLDQERTLWLFGDTFVAPDEGRKDRRGMDVVLGTTLAISTCSNAGEFKIRYYLKKKNGEFISSFGENEWLWPQDPFIVTDVLHIPLLAIEALPKEHEPFNFRVAGHKIAVIKDFAAADPHTWKVVYLDITKSIPAEITSLAATAIVYRGYVYFYPLCKFEADGALFPGNILARVLANKLNNGKWDIEFFNNDEKWDKKLDARQVKIMFPEALSELSVRYRPDDNHWIAVYTSTKGNGGQLLYQKAKSPQGPWTEPKVLVEKVPEVDEQSPLYDKNTFCYAGKEHIQFARKKNIVATYVCNSLEDPEAQNSFIRKNLFLYRPVVVNISY